MRFLSLSLVLLLAGAVAAVPAESPFPQPAPVPSPMPQPAPAGSVLNLTPDVLYVFSDKDGELVVQPEGLVTVMKEPGPVTFKGKFAGGTGSIEKKTFPGPFVYSVDAVPGKSGRVYLALVRDGWKKGEPIPTTALDVNGGSPQPDPKPKPDPQPDPKPAPVKVDSVWVIVVEDASAPRALDTAKALNDPFWAALKPKHDFRHYRSDAKPALDNGYVEQGKKVGFPAVLVLDAKDGDVLKAFKLGTVADLASQVKAVVK